jgi:hypothetical protein
VPVVTTFDLAGNTGRNAAGVGGPAAELPEQRKCKLDEIISSAGLLQQRAEQNEQEDERRGDAERNTEHALGREPEMRGGTTDRCALMRHQPRQVRAKEDIGEEHD